MVHRLFLPEALSIGRCFLSAACLLGVILAVQEVWSDQPPQYFWLASVNPEMSIKARIKPPTGFQRVKVSQGSFAEWLRNMPLKSGRPPVYLFNGREKPFQDAHFAVLDIDIGKRDLQQCADAVIRLRAEYLFASAQTSKITFDFSSGDQALYLKWAEGYRPRVQGNKVSWTKLGSVDRSYQNFRFYLDTVFTYAGSYSLSREMQKVPDVSNMRIGDVFIQGGFPGHACLVVDMAESAAGQKLFMLAQSFMPAQDIHILKNPAAARNSPWYSLEFGDKLTTPEWEFTSADLRRFKS